MLWDKFGSRLPDKEKNVGPIALLYSTISVIRWPPGLHLVQHTKKEMRITAEIQAERLRSVPDSSHSAHFHWLLQDVAL